MNSALAKSVDNFATELLKNAVTFESIANSTLKFKGDTAAALLTTVKDLILEMQSAGIPENSEETLDDRYRAQFDALTHAIGALKQADGGMKRGREGEVRRAQCSYGSLHED